MTFTPEELRLLAAADELMREERRRPADPGLRDRRARRRAQEAERLAAVERRKATRMQRAADRAAERQRRSAARALRPPKVPEAVREVGPRWIDRAILRLVVDGRNTLTRIDDALRSMGAAKSTSDLFAALARLQARGLVAGEGESWTATNQMQRAP